MVDSAKALFDSYFAANPGAVGSQVHDAVESDFSKLKADALATTLSSDAKTLAGELSDWDSNVKNNTISVLQQAVSYAQGGYKAAGAPDPKSITLTSSSDD